MKPEEAKRILSAYRPDGRDADDREMREALAETKRDPALAEWFARERAHDAAIAGKLAGIAPPSDLRAAILAGVSARSVQRTGTLLGWRTVIFAAAAAIAVLLSVTVTRLNPAVQGASFQDFAVNVVANGFFLEKRGENVAELKAWLAERRGPLPGELPAEFARLRALGCRTLTFQGRDVSLVCFERDGKEYHVFVARRDDLKAEPLDSTPRFLSRDKLVAATWSGPSVRYVVVSDASMEALKRVL